MTFWREKPLTAMSESEWESLCDGCGKCCLNKLEDEDDGSIHWTNVACRFLDHDRVQCSVYALRRRYVWNCVKVTPDMGDRLVWMPPSCAYRLLAEGKDLPNWHPLVTGDRESTIKAGMSVRGRAVDERDAGDFEDHVVDWPGAPVDAGAPASQD